MEAGWMMLELLIGWFRLQLICSYFFVYVPGLLVTLKHHTQYVITSLCFLF